MPAAVTAVDQSVTLDEAATLNELATEIKQSHASAERPMADSLTHARAGRNSARRSATTWTARGRAS
jgi:hypothetical protein